VAVVEVEGDSVVSVSFGVSYKSWSKEEEHKEWLL